MNYEEIDWAEASKCSAGLAIEEKLTVSVSKIIGVSGNIVRGNKDKPLKTEQLPYKVQISSARKIYVVLYDVAAQRGWLADGASVLLHLVRTQVVQEPYGGPGCLFDPKVFSHPEIDSGPNAAANALKEDQNMKHIILREFDSYENEKISHPQPKIVSTTDNQSNYEPPGQEIPDPDKGVKEVYKRTCFKELVSKAWSTLEQIHDYEVDLATSHNVKNLRFQSRPTLEGYEFMDIVSAEHSLTRRAVTLESNGKAWVNLAKQIRAVTLFGRHFGEMYRPAETVRAQTCKLWQNAPPGHEYLAVPISLLKEIKASSRRKGDFGEDSSKIAEALDWLPSEQGFNTCGKKCTRSHDHVQTLHPSWPMKRNPRSANSKQTDILAKINGAIIFGISGHLDTSKLKFLSTVEARPEITHNDSGLGSSLQISSPNNSNGTDSGVDVDMTG